jgi:DNA (cytosine-5)-methyltransferase 1
MKIMTAFYNEIDPYAADWLRNLIAAGLIAPGVVDQRSIEEINPDELQQYTQCHFFAGIGGWSYALRLAGWPDDRPVWTGSCPCQPFSSAGKQKGKADERHLWPVWFRLISQCRPGVVFGEQVSSAIAHGWWDEVATDLEAQGYACGAAVLPACSVGAPHRRDRLWFVGYPQHYGRDDFALGGGNPTAVQHHAQGSDGAVESAGTGATDDVADATVVGSDGRTVGEHHHAREVLGRETGASNGTCWLECPDGKERLVEPSIRLLADGAANRVGRLRAYGNAIVPQVAQAFIEAYLEH